jgi:sugar lactone lactonase YvrE
MGIADGPGATAEFMMPAGVAFAPNGDVYVADAAAQRIRVIDGSGFVRTVAGGGALNATGMWVEGDYKDGPAASARFNRPTGIAIGKDGTIYVADESNRAIRKIQGGVVSTLTGGPTLHGGVDGAPGIASFNAPRSLAVGPDGTLYVADTGNGIRKIDPSGNVVTLHPERVTPNVTGVALLQLPNGSSELYVADRVGLSFVEAASGKLTFRYDQGHAEGDVSIGSPVDLCPLSLYNIVYTDAYTHALRFFSIASSNYTRLLSRDATENPQVSNGGFADGSGNVARFDAPMGIACSPAGRIVVADAGNKRVREVGAFDMRSGETPPQFDAPNREHEFRIALLGNSFIWTGSAPRETIGDQIEIDLDRDPGLRAKGLTVRVIPIRKYGIVLPAASDYIREFLSDGQVDAVVLLVNSQFVASTVGPGKATTPEAAAVFADFTKQLDGIHHQLAQQKIAFLAVAVPFAFEFSPLENAYGMMTGIAGTYVPPDSDADYSIFHAKLIAAMRASGAPVLDAWQTFAAEERSPEHRPLYGASELHLGPHGDAVLASAIAQALAARKPWASSKP